MRNKYKGTTREYQECVFRILNELKEMSLPSESKALIQHLISLI